MAKRSRTRDEYDSPWKDALGALLPAFLAFFYADIHVDIDWSRGYESLDKEFQQIARRAKVGKRLADKLFKVWLKDGTERWLLIHVEIQGEYEREFPARMFEYHVAARQLYNQEVVSLAVLCDENASWRPTTFGYSHWGCRLELTFRIAKLIDFARDKDALETSDNPFAAVVLTHFQALETREDPLTRSVWKIRLVKGLYRRNWSGEDIRRLFLLIDWMLALPDELETQFWHEVVQLEKEQNVQYVHTGERIGIKKGIQQGIEQGIEQGRREGLLEGIALVLDTKFGREGAKLARKIQALNVAGLRKFARYLKKPRTVDDVREYLS